ncbi:MAG: hypothetical protein QOD41_1338 [Cryptosporangiaceae bacterium]|nr:hypothetical protein [Cryptosporangiaceae bacterium]
MHELTVSHVDRNGEPDTDYGTVIVDNVSGRYNVAFGDDVVSTSTLRVPKSTYTVVSFITTYDPDGGSPVDAELVEPSVTLDQDRTVTFDARVASPVKVVVPEANAQSYRTDAIVNVSSEPGYSYEVGLVGPSYDTMLIGQADPKARSPWVNSTLFSTWVPGPVDPEGNVAFSYNLAWRQHGFLPSGATHVVKKSDLAVVHVDFATQGLVQSAVTANPWYDGQFNDWARPLVTALPSKRTEYYTTGGGALWSQDLVELEDYSVHNWTSSTPRSFQRGRTYTEHRNRGVFGPSFDTWSSGGSYDRVADWVAIAASQVGPAGDWFGASWPGKHHVVLERDGKQVGELDTRFGAIRVPDPTKGRYTLTIDSGRGEHELLSTRVTTVYGFDSGHVDGDVGVPLPFSAIRFSPALDQQNTAPAGTLFAIPVEVLRQAHSPAAPAKSLTVDVSYDDGATWTKAFVLRNGSKGVALVAHPRKAGFVSLRATSADTAGNTVTQTIIHAYRIA